MRKLQDVYLPTLKANFILWPIVQVLNFRVVPIRFQIVGSLPSYDASAATDVLLAVRLYYRDRVDCLPVAVQL